MSSGYLLKWLDRYQVKSLIPASFTASSNQCLYPFSGTPSFATNTRPRPLEQSNNVWSALVATDRLLVAAQSGPHSYQPHFFIPLGQQNIMRCGP